MRGSFVAGTLELFFGSDCALCVWQEVESHVEA